MNICVIEFITFWVTFRLTNIYICIYGNLNTGTVPAKKSGTVFMQLWVIKTYVCITSISDTQTVVQL